MERMLKWVSVFIAFAFTAPIAAEIFWPLGHYKFLGEVIFLLWPTGWTLIYAYDYGAPLAFTFGVGTNVLMYSAIGVAAASAERLNISVWFVYIGACAILLGFRSDWVPKFDHIDSILLVAFACLALPFLYHYVPSKVSRHAAPHEAP